MLYVAEALALLLTSHNRLFDTAFYRLFLTRALIHIVGYFNSIVNLRFGRLGLFYSLYVEAGSFFIAVNWFLC